MDRFNIQAIMALDLFTGCGGFQRPPDGSKFTYYNQLCACVSVKTLTNICTILSLLLIEFKGPVCPVLDQHSTLLLPPVSVWRDRSSLTDTTFSHGFNLFLCGGPCHLSGFEQCLEDRVFLWEQLSSLFTEQIYVSEFVLFPHLYCKYQNYKFGFHLQNYILPL